MNDRNDTSHDLQLTIGPLDHKFFVTALIANICVYYLTGFSLSLLAIVAIDCIVGFVSVSTIRRMPSSRT